MTGWVCSCVCGHAFIKHHNFGVPVLTLSHILDITDICGQWYTDMSKSYGLLKTEICIEHKIFYQLKHDQDWSVNLP